MLCRHDESLLRAQVWHGNTWHTPPATLRPHMSPSSQHCHRTTPGIGAHADACSARVRHIQRAPLQAGRQQGHRQDSEGSGSCAQQQHDADPAGGPPAQLPEWEALLVPDGLLLWRLAGRSGRARLRGLCRAPCILPPSCELRTCAAMPVSSNARRRWQAHRMAALLVWEMSLAVVNSGQVRLRVST